MNLARLACSAACLQGLALLSQALRVVALLQWEDGRACGWVGEWW